MLLEAILTVVIVSICLTYIAQSLLTNFRTGVRFQEMTRSLILMENRLGPLYAANASEDETQTINDHLKEVVLKLSWPGGKSHYHLDVTTMIYDPDET